MKKLALLVYPEFSLQEVMNLSRLFRWEYDIATEVIATGKEAVKSEEGIYVLPQKTTGEFRKEDYVCLILPGCSDFTEVLKDQGLIDFLHAFCDDNAYPIGAICSAPILLARAGVLKDRPYTASIFMDLFDFLPFLKREHYVASPLVAAGNIITAGGSNFNGFAVAMARLLGQECPDRILSGYMDAWLPEDYDQYLPSEGRAELEQMFAGIS